MPRLHNRSIVQPNTGGHVHGPAEAYVIDRLTAREDATT